ncbi:beta-galactosidase [Cupriavidus malaysiensis]|uniref:Glycoside hydrolase family 42 N-terminal domain-containing protein n=1 Tax=Cupriavidus malaysiensis TaxID=367825 RepID=A0ABN4TMS8_9BURK|nr:beta-galactosidase [Cupriavidus malaysiensis]AOZ05374.1 hypothetical protein BKK80_05815 [Cupriavidus malaysiensis]
MTRPRRGLLPRLLLPLALAASLMLPASGQIAERAWRGMVPREASYFRFEIDEDALRGAPDQSALNTPLDAASRLFVRDGHFYQVGADLAPGTADDRRVRLFGVNLTFGGNFPDAAGAVALARRLRKLGVNAVRLHHLDSLPSDEREAPLSILSSGPYPSFNPVAVARLRHLIDALASEGIYIDLNLHVGYRFRPAVDDLPALDDGMTMPPLDAPIHVYDERLIARQIGYARGLIDGLGLRRNPALALVEIDNESSLLNAWHNGHWSEAIPSAYAPELRRRWRGWLQQRYATLAAACDAWGGCDDGPDSAARLPEPGRARGQGAQRRLSDFLEFLAATDKAYFDRLRAAVHEAGDPLVPVTGTQMTFGGAMNFDAQASMDFIDEHIYVAHPNYPGGRGDAGRWRIPVLSASADEMNRLLALGQRRDRRRPFVVSEYNEPFPNPRGSEIIPIMSLLAAQQDWDGIFFFEYSDSATPPRAPARFNLAGDWGKYVLAGPSARLFRTFGLAPLPDRIDLPLAPADRLRIGLSERADALEHDLHERLGATPELAWRGRVAADLAPAAASVRLPAPGQGPYATPDGAVRFDPVAGRLLVDTPRLWGLFGTTASARLGTEAAWMQFDAGGQGSASVWLASLDGADLGRSRHMLLSMGTLTLGASPGAAAGTAASAAAGAAAGADPGRPARIVPYDGDLRWLTLASGVAGGDAPPRATEPPTWMARLPVTLGLGARPGVLRIYPLDGTGQRRSGPRLPEVSSGPSGWTIALQRDAATSSPWYEIEITPN